MKILASGWVDIFDADDLSNYINSDKDCCGFVLYSKKENKADVKVHIVLAEKPYCPKHGLMHGKKYKSCKGREFNANKKNR